VLVALTIHEAAHAWTADRLGDSTARLLGRVSLNPIVHIDIIGTVILPLLAAFSGLPIIGWARPVPVNINRLRQPRRDFTVIAAAGPISNLLQALVAAAVLQTQAAFFPGSLADPGSRVIGDVLELFVRINVLLALFNLIPVPPLDGGNVLAGLLPPSAAGVLLALRQWGFLILYALMLSGILSSLLLPPARFLLEVLLP
jgi:Zn-dependent protease